MHSAIVLPICCQSSPSIQCARDSSSPAAPDTRSAAAWGQSILLMAAMVARANASPSALKSKVWIKPCSVSKTIFHLAIIKRPRASQSSSSTHWFIPFPMPLPRVSQWIPCTKVSAKISAVLSPCARVEPTSRQSSRAIKPLRVSAMFAAQVWALSWISGQGIAAMASFSFWAKSCPTWFHSPASMAASTESRNGLFASKL